MAPTNIRYWTTNSKRLVPIALVVIAISPNWLYGVQTPKVINHSQDPEPIAVEEPEQLPRVWTLDLAIDRARSHNFEILQARANVKRTDASRMIARASLLPKVRIVADADKIDKALIDSPPTATDIPVDTSTANRQSREGFNSSLEIRQSIYSASQNGRAHKAEKLIAQGALSNARDVEQRVIALLTQSYDSLLLANEAMRIRTQSIDTFSRLLAIAEKRYNAGDIPELEIFRIKTELSRSQANLSRADSQRIASEERLKLLLGLPRNYGRIELNGTLKQAVRPIRTDATAEHALVNRMDLNAASLEYQAAQQKLEAAKLSKLPTLDAIAGYDYRSSFYENNSDIDGWRFALVASVDLFSSGEAKGVKKLRMAEVEAARLKHDNLKQNIESQIEEFHSKLSNEEKTLQSRYDAVNYGLKALQQIEKQYEAGQIGLESVLNSEEQLHNSQIELAQSIYSYNATVAQLHYTTASITNTRVDGEEATLDN